MLHFLRVNWPEGADATLTPPAEPLRLAVCRVYTPVTPIDGMLAADMDRVVDERAFLVDQLGPTLVTAVPRDAQTPKLIHGIKYGNRSQLQ